MDGPFDNLQACPNLQEYWKSPPLRNGFPLHGDLKSHAVILAVSIPGSRSKADARPTKDAHVSFGNSAQ